ncbi:hypothetical protein NDU88_001796 [Pleurodeles waltl]|uniref:Uncharacterized protein n=1 Tax=Pleurodeles waltl TaxID=8319 RepID=A0AAV7NFT8_PLEWA|nr:hypothetical protein NDU88_001796 [Pleurodeles waltl]
MRCVDPEQEEKQEKEDGSEEEDLSEEEDKGEESKRKEGAETDSEREDGRRDQRKMAQDPECDGGGRRHNPDGEQ